MTINSFTFCTGICGDGKQVSDEFCDDGSTDGIGCKADCTGDAPGYTCLGGTPTTPSVCYETCGDNVITPSEQCEDQDVGL